MKLLFKLFDASFKLLVVLDHLLVKGRLALNEVVSVVDSTDESLCRDAVVGGHLKHLRVCKAELLPVLRGSDRWSQWV